MPRAAPTLAVAALALALAACTSSADEPRAAAAALPVTASAHPPAEARPRLVFFMNPYGGPCQMQDRILHELSGELGSRVAVVYYRTTEAADLSAFQRYGIRSLPQLLVTDASGRELRRATPGIQGAEQVRALVTF
jgi:thioredoxin 1